MAPKDDTAIARLEVEMDRAQEDISQLQGDVKAINKTIWMAMGIVGLCSSVFAPVIVGLVVYFMTTHQAFGRESSADIRIPENPPPAIDTAWKA